MNKKRSFFRLIGRDPHVDWLLSILVSFVMVVVFIAIGVEKYFSYEKIINDQVSVAKTKDSTIIDVKALDIVLGKYDERARLRNELIRQYVGPSDPSLK